MQGPQVKGFLSHLGVPPGLGYLSRPLRIAMVGQFTNREHWAGWLALAFQKKGHDVRAFDYREKTRTIGDMTGMNRSLVRTVRGWDSEVVVVVKGEQIQPGSLETLRKDGCRTVLLANDDHQVWREVSLPLGKHCDKVFTFTEKMLPQYKQEGIDAEFMLFYADPSITAEWLGKNEKNYDVSFVGTYYPEREPLVKALIDSGLRFHLIGDGWESHLPLVHGDFYGGRADYDEVLKTWSQSKVCLNIHQVGLEKLGVRANLRCYELGAEGCFMFTDHVEGMREVLGDGFFSYPDEWTAEEGVLQIRILASDKYAETRKEKAALLHKTVLERHTAAHRASQILQSLKLEVPA